MSRADAVGIAPQRDIDTQATVVAYSPPLTGEQLVLNRATLDINEMTGNRGPTRSEYGVRSLSGPLNGALRPASGGLILASFFGAPLTTAPVVGAQAHTFDALAAAYPVPLSIWGVNNDRMRATDGTVLPPLVSKYIGAVGNQITLSCEVNNYLLVEAGYVALDVNLEAPAPSMTKDNSGKWAFNQLVAQISVAGGPLVETPLGSFSFAYNNNLIDDQGRLGSLMLDDIPLGPEIESTLTFTALRDIPAHYKRAFADSPEQVRIKIIATGPSIGATASNFALELDFPYLETVTAPVGRSGSDTLRNVEVTANIVTDDATGKLFTAVLTNADSGALYREPVA